MTVFDSNRYGSRWVVALCGLLLLAPAGARCQTGLERAVETAREAWLRHAYSDLMATSDTVRLTLPEVGRAPAMRPAHAARVLRDYLELANEVTFELRLIRPAADDHAYAQLVRRYVVEGTSDERVETVFFGFRLIDGIWRLREVRVTP